MDVDTVEEAVRLVLVAGEAVVPPTGAAPSEGAGDTIPAPGEEEEVAAATVVVETALMGTTTTVRPTTTRRGARPDTTMTGPSSGPIPANGGPAGTWTTGSAADMRYECVIVVPFSGHCRRGVIECRGQESLRNFRRSG